MIRIDVKDFLTPELNQLVAGMRSRGFITAVARGVRNAVQGFYRGLQFSRPNKMGWRRLNFWADVAKSVQLPEIQSAAQATISVNHVGIRQRIQGGYIRPTGGRKYLTLPADERAYGMRAREFHNLHFGFAENRWGNLAPALLENWSQDVRFGKQRKDGSRKVTPGPERGGDVIFWLVQKVYQRPDPAARPTDEALFSAGTEAGNDYAQVLSDRANEGKN